MEETAGAKALGYLVYAVSKQGKQTQKCESSGATEPCRPL